MTANEFSTLRLINPKDGNLSLLAHSRWALIQQREHCACVVPPNWSAEAWREPVCGHHAALRHRLRERKVAWCHARISDDVVLDTPRLGLVKALDAALEAAEAGRDPLPDFLAAVDARIRSFDGGDRPPSPPAALLRLENILRRSRDGGGV